MKTEITPSSFRDRIALVIGDEEPFTWAKRIGIASATFDRFWNGGAIPKADTLLKIANGTGVSLDWLLLDKGGMFAHPRQPLASEGLSFEPELMARVTDMISRTYKEVGAAISPADLGRLSIQTYAEILRDAEAPEDYEARVLLAGNRLRRLLKEAAPGSGKRSA